MRIRIYFAIFLAFIMIAPPLYSGHPPDGRTDTIGPTSSRDEITDDDLVWSGDIRLTTNDIEEMEPRVHVDDNSSYVLWGSDGNINFMRIGRDNGTITVNKTLGQGLVPVHDKTSQAEEYVGFSDDHMFALLCSNAFSACNVQRFYLNGTPDTAGVPAIFESLKPHDYSLGVGLNNNVYVGGIDSFGNYAHLQRTDPNLNPMMDDFEMWVNHTSVHTNQFDGDSTVMTYIRTTQVLKSIRWAKVRASMQYVRSSHVITTPFYMDQYSAAPKFESTSDKRIHTILANRTNSTRSLYYMYYDKDTNILGTHLITDNAADYGDLAPTSDNGVYMVWTNATDMQLRYARISKDYAGGPLEVIRLTNSSGSNLGANIDTDADDDLYVSWISNRSGKNEVYYKWAGLEAVRLDMNATEKARLTPIMPNETLTAKAYLKNYGKFQHMFDLRFEVTGGTGWSVTSSVDPILLGSGEGTEVQVSVTSPQDNSTDLVVSIDLFFEARDDISINDSVMLELDLAVRHDFTLLTDVAHTILRPNENATVNVTMRNTGTVYGTVLLTVDGGQLDISMMQAPMLLDRGQEATVKFRIGVPVAMVPGDYLVNVTGTMDGLFNNWSIVEVEVPLVEEWALEVIGDVHQAVVGEETSISLRVSNRGNDPDPGSVYLKVNEDYWPNPWALGLPTNGLRIDPNTYLNVTISVLPYDEVASGDTTILPLELRDFHGFLLASENVTIVALKPRMVLTADSFDKEGPGGSSVEFDFLLANLGNYYANATLGVEDLDPEVGHFFNNSYGDKVTEVYVLHGTGRMLTINISIPSDWYLPGEVLSFRVTATNRSQVVYLPLNLTIIERNDPPFFIGTPSTEVTEGDIYTYGFQYNDPNGDPVTITLVEGPPGMVLAPSGTFTWSSTTGKVGLHQVIVQISDGEFIVTYTFNITVREKPVPNSKPVIDPVENQEIYPGLPLVVMVTATDPDGDVLQFAMEEGPEGMGINNNSGMLGWVPTEGQIGTHKVVIRVSDGEASSTVSFTIDVKKIPKVVEDPGPLVAFGAMLLLLLILVPIIIVIVVIVVLFMILRKRKGPDTGTGGQYPPPGVAGQLQQPPTPYQYGYEPQDAPPAPAPPPEPEHPPQTPDGATSSQSSPSQEWPPPQG